MAVHVIEQAKSQKQNPEIITHGGRTKKGVNEVGGYPKKGGADTNKGSRIVHMLDDLGANNDVKGLTTRQQRLYGSHTRAHWDQKGTRDLEKKKIEPAGTAL